MKRKQRRWNTEGEIIGHIENLYSRAASSLAHAIQCDKDADGRLREIQELTVKMETCNNRKLSDDMQLRINELTINTEELRVQARKHSKTRIRIEEVSLPKMKQVLAAFRTQPMASIVDDESVVS